jgi:hypothetical protein
MAVWHGQVDFVRRELDASNDCLAEGESRVDPELDIPPLGRPSLLLSASCQASGSEIVSLLLRRGFSSQSYVSLFDMVINKSIKVVTLWVVFIAHLSRFSNRYGLGGIDNPFKHLFENLEKFLLEGDQVPVVLLGGKAMRKKRWRFHGYRSGNPSES